MFKNIESVNGAERIIRKWPRGSVKVVNYIWRRLCGAIQVDGVLHSFSAAARIQHIA
jgi:hypothetical protein